MNDCLDRAKPGDIIWIKRVDPDYTQGKKPFPTIMVGRSRFNNAPILGSNAKTINGRRSAFKSSELHIIANHFTNFASCSFDRFIVTRIIKKDVSLYS